MAVSLGLNCTSRVNSLEPRSENDTHVTRYPLHVRSHADSCANYCVRRINSFGHCDRSHYGCAGARQVIFIAGHLLPRWARACRRTSNPVAFSPGRDRLRGASAVSGLARSPGRPHSGAFGFRRLLCCSAYARPSRCPLLRSGCGRGGDAHGRSWPLARELVSNLKNWLCDEHSLAVPASSFKTDSCTEWKNKPVRRVRWSRFASKKKGWLATSS